VVDLNTSVNDVSVNASSSGGVESVSGGQGQGGFADTTETPRSAGGLGLSDGDDGVLLDQFNFREILKYLQRRRNKRGEEVSKLIEVFPHSMS
jgi:hypothetical protein